MHDLQPCDVCGTPATKLCDWVTKVERVGWYVRRGKGPGVVAKTRIIKTSYSTLDAAWETCDRPLCGTHAHVQSTMFSCGESGCDMATVDYCPEHHAYALAHGVRLPIPSEGHHSL